MNTLGGLQQTVAKTTTTTGLDTKSFIQLKCKSTWHLGKDRQQCSLLWRSTLEPLIWPQGWVQMG